MGIMGFLRNRAGVILIAAIGFALFAFLLGDAVQMGGGSTWGGNPNEVGEVAGEAVTYEEFKAKVDQNEANFRQQMGGELNPQMSAYVVENTWNQTISEILVDKEVERLGLQVSKTELNDMIHGSNPHAQVVQAFADPATGQINRSQIASFMDNVKMQGPNSDIGKQWGNFLTSIRRDRLFQKYNNLVKNSVYVTSLEAREDYSQRNKTANFSYVNLDYASIPDNKVTLTDGDYSDYYNENKKRFRNREETRAFDYIVFDANPSKADSAAVRAAINKIAADLRTTTNDSLFVAINADTKTPLTYVKKGQLDPALDSAVFNAAPGSIVGPVFTGGAFKVAKVLDAKISPDSVKASHILLNPATEGGLDKARAKADSILALIRKGTSFAEMAAKFSIDPSKSQGGDLGTFGRGAMVPAFEEAAFNGKTGDLKVVTSQFGVHIVRIDKQVGASKVVKAAIVDKNVRSSSETLQQAYRQASEFLGAADDAKDFDKKAAGSKLAVQKAENVSASQPSIQGLENPRELVRWAFEAEEGDVTDKVYELGNQYVVAKMTDIREKGILPLEKVKKDIEPMVRNRVKAKMLTEQMEKALNGSSSISQVAQKLKKPVQPAQNIVFANPIIPGGGQENKVIGTVFGSQVNKLSKPIEGESGVYVVQVNGFSTPAPLTNTFKQKEQILQSVSQRAQSQFFEILKDKAEIKDNRLRFF
ncbi:SurA N-terminal domain-containing protein [Paradesertivirga mongoliensis]|uniref:Periplasmic chaperone PpiD n=1 Tax=Paradesertivirga mongoliensis TaxID=2100740 RepID=A0ABW4ZJV4_9SPHI|nr:peptidylprolyl isomerase [Pedobacter mongoliensis]